MTTLYHSVAVVGAVIHDDKALCIRRADNGHWETPAGILEQDESLQQGVVREVFEETGYQVEPLFVGAIYKNHAHPLRPVSIVFRCELVSGHARTSNETTSVEWLTKDEIRARMTTAHAARLLDVWDLDSGASAKSHDGINFLGHEDAASND